MAVQAYISDFQLKKDCQYLSGQLVLGNVRLYKNAWAPTNNQVIGSFSECTFAGYAPQPLAGLSLGTTQLASGVMQLRMKPVFFNSTGGGPVQFINGWFITDVFNNVLVAVPLAAPQIVSGIGVFRFDVVLQVRGLNIVCP